MKKGVIQEGSVIQEKSSLKCGMDQKTCMRRESNKGWSVKEIHDLAKRCGIIITHPNKRTKKRELLCEEISNAEEIVEEEKKEEEVGKDESVSDSSLPVTLKCGMDQKTCMRTESNKGWSVKEIHDLAKRCGIIITHPNKRTKKRELLCEEISNAEEIVEEEKKEEEVGKDESDTDSSLPVTLKCGMDKKTCITKNGWTFEDIQDLAKSCGITITNPDKTRKGLKQLCEEISNAEEIVEGENHPPKEKFNMELVEPKKLKDPAKSPKSLRSCFNTNIYKWSEFYDFHHDAIDEITMKLTRRSDKEGHENQNDLKEVISDEKLKYLSENLKENYDNTAIYLITWTFLLKHYGGVTTTHEQGVKKAHLLFRYLICPSVVVDDKDLKTSIGGNLQVTYTQLFALQMWSYHRKALGLAWFNVFEWLDICKEGPTSDDHFGISNPLFCALDTKQIKANVTIEKNCNPYPSRGRGPSTQNEDLCYRGKEIAYKMKHGYTKLTLFDGHGRTLYSILSHMREELELRKYTFSFVDMNPYTDEWHKIFLPADSDNFEIKTINEDIFNSIFQFSMIDLLLGKKGEFLTKAFQLKSGQNILCKPSFVYFNFCSLVDKHMCQTFSLNRLNLIRLMLVVGFGSLGFGTLPYRCDFESFFISFSILQGAKPQQNVFFGGSITNIPDEDQDLIDNCGTKTTEKEQNSCFNKFITTREDLVAKPLTNRDQFVTYEINRMTAPSEYLQN